MPIEYTKDATHSLKLLSLGSGVELDDVYQTDDKEKPMSGGIYTHTHQDKPFTYTYKYDELKIVLEGTIVFKDVETGQVIEGKPGDIMKIGKGTTIEYSSPDFGKAFYVGQRALREW